MGVGCRLGMGQVQKRRLCAELTAGLLVKVVLGVLLELRVQVRLTVVGMGLGGGITPACCGALTGKCRHRWRKGGQLGGELRWRNGRWDGRREAGEVRNGASQDRAVGADDGLHAGHSVHGPEMGETVSGGVGARMMKNQ